MVKTDQYIMKVIKAETKSGWTAFFGRCFLKKGLLGVLFCCFFGLGVWLFWGVVRFGRMLGSRLTDSGGSVICFFWALYGTGECNCRRWQRAIIDGFAPAVQMVRCTCNFLGVFKM